MWNVPSQDRLNRIPRLYETEQIPPAEKMIHLHFFIGGCDWYIAEFDGKDIFFGYAILNDDLECAEWGYVSFEEMKSLKIRYLEVDCELEELWVVKKAREIPRIGKLE